MLLAALEQFEDQATNRLLLAALDMTGTTQKKEEIKAPAKMILSTLSKHCSYVEIVHARYEVEKYCHEKNDDNGKRSGSPKSGDEVLICNK